MTDFNKATGYRMADRALAYNKQKFDTVCFQRQLREKLDTGARWSLDGAEIRQIDFHTAQDFILKYEWLGSMGVTKFSFGLFVQHEGSERLAAVACFGVTAGTMAIGQPFGQQNKHLGIVLVRGATAPEAHEHTSSYMVGNVMKHVRALGYQYVIAYSDPEAGEIGTVYQATNWLFYGMTSPVKYLIRPDGKRVDPKLISKYAKKFGITRQQQEANFLAEGYTWGKGSPKLKYVQLTGDKRERKALMAKIQVPVYPYLKRPATGDMRVVYEAFKQQGKSIDTRPQHA